MLGARRVLHGGHAATPPHLRAVGQGTGPWAWARRRTRQTHRRAGRGRAAAGGGGGESAVGGPPAVLSPPADALLVISGRPSPAAPCCGDASADRCVVLAVVPLASIHESMPAAQRLELVGEARRAARPTTEGGVKRLGAASLEMGLVIQATRSKIGATIAGRLRAAAAAAALRQATSTHRRPLPRPSQQQLCAGNHNSPLTQGMS